MQMWLQIVRKIVIIKIETARISEYNQNNTRRKINISIIPILEARRGTKINPLQARDSDDNARGSNEVEKMTQIQ